MFLKNLIYFFCYVYSLQSPFSLWVSDVVLALVKETGILNVFLGNFILSGFWLSGKEGWENIADMAPLVMYTSD